MGQVEGTENSLDALNGADIEERKSISSFKSFVEVLLISGKNSG